MAELRKLSRKNIEKVQSNDGSALSSAVDADNGTNAQRTTSNGLRVISRKAVDSERGKTNSSVTISAEKPAPGVSGAETKTNIVGLDENTSYFANQFIKGINKYIEVQNQGATEETLAKRRNGINHSLDVVKKNAPEFYEKNKDYFDEMLKTLDKTYRDYQIPVYDAYADYVKLATSDAPAENVEKAKNAVKGKIETMKLRAPEYFSDNAVENYEILSEVLPADEIKSNIDAWGDDAEKMRLSFVGDELSALEAEKSRLTVELRGAERMLKSDGAFNLEEKEVKRLEGVVAETQKALNEVNEKIETIKSKASRDKDDIAYNASRAYEKARYIDKYGKKWEYATIEGADGKIDKTKVPTNDVLKKILLADVEKYEHTQSAYTSSELGVINTSKSGSDKIKNGDYDSNAPIVKNADGKYVLFGYNGVSFTAEEIAQMGEMFKNGDGNKVGDYIEKFVRPRRNGETRKSNYEKYASMAESESPFVHAGGTLASFVEGKMYSVPAAMESLAATIDGTVSGVRPNKDYGLTASAKGGVDSGRQEVGTALYKPVVGLFVEEEKEAEASAKVFSWIDSATNSTVNMALGGTGSVILNSIEAMHGSLDEGIQSGRDPKKTLSKATVVTAGEILTEGIEVQAWKNMLVLNSTEMKLGRRYAKNLVGGYANELPGELTSSYLEVAIDNALYGYDSNMNREITSMVEEGKAKTRGEAAHKYLADIGIDTAVSTFLTQGLLAGAQVVADPKNKTAKNYADFGRRFRDGEINVTTLVEQAKNSANSVTRTIANKAGTNAEKLSDADLGLFYFVAKGDYIEGKLDTNEYATGKMFEAMGKKVNDAGNAQVLIDLARTSNDKNARFYGELADQAMKQDGKVSDAQLGRVYQALAENKYVEARDMLVQNEKGTANAIEDVAKTAVDDALVDVSKANTVPETDVELADIVTKKEEKKPLAVKRAEADETIRVEVADKDTFSKQFGHKKGIKAVGEDALSGTDNEVGKIVVASDLENTVIDLAKASGNAEIRESAKKYENSVYSNANKLNEIGRIAKAVGITGTDAVQSLAASIGQKYMYAVRDAGTFDRFSSELRAEFEGYGNEFGIQALDYLDAIYEKRGALGIQIAINAVTNTGYSLSNKNKVVENFATAMQYALKAMGNDVTINVVYDKKAPRGHWEKVGSKTTITINGTKIRGAESASWVLSHELFHEGSKNNPGLADRVIDVFRKMGLYDEKSFRYFAELYGPVFEKQYNDKLKSGAITQDEYDDMYYRYINEEIAADIMFRVIGSEELTTMFANEASYEDLNFIAKFFKKFFGGIKKVFTGTGKADKFAYEADTIVGQFERAIKNKDNTKTNNETDTRNSLSSIGYSFYGNENLTAKEAEKMLEDGTWKESEGYKKYLNDCVSVYEQAYGKASKKDIAQIEKSIEGIMRVAIAAKKAGYDIQDNGAKRNTRDSKNRLLFTSLEPNSDYITSSDISAICDKRKTFTEIYDDIVRIEEANNVPPSERFFSDVNNYFLLHKIMASKGLVVPCEECYVESMRKNLAPMANAFITLVTETDSENKKNAQLYNQSGKKKGTLKENNAKIREKVIEICAKNGGSKEQIDKIRNLSADELAKFIDNVGSAENLGVSLDEITVEMLTTAEGLAQLKLRSPLLYEAFNSFYGQSKPKMPKEATPFRPGELIALFTDKNNKINTTLIEKVKSTGGFRLQSYSDFQIGNFVDVLQTIFEASMLGLNGHAYTKVPAFLDATEGTNLKRNLSIFMYEDGGKWMLDKKNSFPMELDDIYALVAKDKSGNTSIIAVSQNAKMSAWIMANDLVGYGIPFHKSGLKMDIVRLRDVKTPDGRTIKGYSNQIDHTKQQSEVYKYDKDGKKKNSKVSKPIDIYSFWDFENKEGLSKNELIEKNLKAYIDECEKAGYRPKFRDYVMNNDKVLKDVLAYSKELGFASEDATIDDISFEYKGYRIPYGYYKFLGDFGMFTPEGKASPIKPLSLATYDFDKAVKYFDNAKALREKELLQQFENGKVREAYRQLLKEGKMTYEELQAVLEGEKNKVVQEVVTGDYKDKKYALQGVDKLDAEYLELAKNPEQNDAKLQKIVDEAAVEAGVETDENGKPETLYHGTARFGFTSVNTDYSDDKFSFWTTPTLQVAKSYNVRSLYSSESELKVRDIGKPSELRNRKSLEPTKDSAEKILSETKDMFPEYKNAYVLSEQEKLDKAKKDIKNAKRLAKQLKWSRKLTSEDATLVDNFLSAVNEGTATALEKATDTRAKISAERLISWDEDSTSKYEDAVRRFVNALDDIYDVVNSGYVSVDDYVDGELVDWSESTKTMAERYNMKYGSGGIYKFYYKTKNQYVIDCKSSNWNEIVAPSEISPDGKLVSTRDIAKWASEKGYDTVKFLNVVDMGSSNAEKVSSTVVAFINPKNQIWSADPVTYDDNDNVIPISERFNPEKNDIRYALEGKNKIDEEYLELAKDPEKNKVKLDEMIAEAARDAGYNSPLLYHGAKGFISNRFDKTLLFTVDNPDVAKTYVGRDGKAAGDGIREFYGNTDDFLVIDAKGSNWNDIPFIPDELSELLGEQKQLESELSQKTKEVKAYAKEHGIDFSEAEFKVKGYAELYDKVEEIYKRVDKAWEDSGLNGEISTNAIAEYAKRIGYKGVTIKNVVDIGANADNDDSVKANVSIFFNPQAQVKSADTVTYDDDNNIIPLSERFNPEKTDLRWALDNENAVFDESQQGKAVRSLKETAKDLGVSRAQTADFVSEVMDALGETLQNGIVSDKTYEDVAKVVFKYAREEAGESDYARTLIDIKKRAYEHGIAVPDSVKGDIADYGKFAKKHGNLFKRYTEGDKNRLAPTVDEIYTDLAKIYPEIFPKDANLGDQIEKISEVIEKAREYEAKGVDKTLNEIYKDFDNAKGLAVDMASEIIDGIAESAGVELVEEQAVYESLREADENIDATEYPEEFYITKGATDEEINEILAGIESTYPKSSDEYKFVKRLLKEEQNVKEAEESVKNLKALIKAKSFEGDNKRINDFSAEIAKEFGFGKDTRKTADVARSIKGLCDSISAYLEDATDDNLNSVVANIGNAVEVISGHTESEVDIDKLGGYLLSNYTSLGKNSKSKIEAKSIDDIAKRKKGTMDVLEKLQQTAETSMEQLENDLEEAKDDLHKATVKLRGQQGQPFFERVIDEVGTVLDEVEVKNAERKLTDEMYYGRKISEYKRRASDEVTKNKEASQRRKEDRSRRKKQENLLAVVRRLIKLKTDKITKQKISELVGNLDAESVSMKDETRRDLELLREGYKVLQQDKDFISNKSIENALERLDKTQISDLTVGELEEMLEKAIMLERDIAFEKSIRVREKAISTHKAAKSGIGAVWEASKGATGKYATNIGSADSFFKKIFNYDNNNVMYQVASELNNAQRESIRLRFELEDMFSDLIADKQIEAFTGKKATEYGIGKKRDNGKEIKITPEMKVVLYLLSKNDAALKHIAGGGITIPDLDLLKKGKVKEAYNVAKTVLKPSEVKKIVSDLTDYENKWADIADVFFNEKSKNLVNKASLELYGYEIADEDNYFPLRTVPTLTMSEPSPLFNDATLEGLGILKERTGADNAIILESLTKVLQRHTRQVAEFSTLAVPIKNFNKAYKMPVKYNGERTSLAEEIKLKFGNEATEFIEKYITDLQAPRQNERTLLDKARSARATALMMFNIPVTIGNFGNLFKAIPRVGVKAIAKGLSGRNVDPELVAKYSPHLALAMKGYTTKEMSDIARGDALKIKKSVASKILNFMQFANIYNMKVLWKASENYINQQNPNFKNEVDEDTYYKAVAEVFNRTVEESMVTDLTSQKSEMLRDPSFLMKEFTMFKSEQMKNIDVIRSASGEYRAMLKKYGGPKNVAAEIKKGNKEVIEVVKHTRGVYASQLATSLYVGVVNMLIKGLLFHKFAYKDEEEDDVTAESAIKGLIADFIDGWVGAFPIIGDLVTAVPYMVEKGHNAFGIDTFMDDQWYAPDVAGLKMITDLVDDSNRFFEDIARVRDGEASWRSIVHSLYELGAKDIAPFFGIPVENFKNIIYETALRGLEIANGKYYGKYLSYKANEDGFRSFTANDMMNTAFEAYNDGDKEAYERIRADMIKNGFVSAKKFDEKFDNFKSKTVPLEESKDYQRVTEEYEKADKKFNRNSSGVNGVTYVYWKQKNNFIEQAQKAIDNGDPKSKEGFEKDLEKRAEGYDGTLSRGEELVAEMYDKTQNGDLFYTKAESYILEQTQNGIKRGKPMSYHDYSAMIKNMNDATEYVALVVFGNNFDRARASKIKSSTSDMSTHIDKGIKDSNTYKKSLTDEVKAGNMTQDEADVLYYKNLVSEIKSEIRADYKEDYFGETK